MVGYCCQDQALKTFGEGPRTALPRLGLVRREP